MRRLRRFCSKLLNLVRPGREEDDLSRELGMHLALLEEQFRDEGLPPDQARRAATLALGGVEQVKELHRDARSFAWLDDARRDARYAVRLLWRNPIMAATAALSLAIGIGANTAIFTVANGLLFRAPVGVADPGSLVDIGIARPGTSGFNPGDYPTYLDIRDRARTLDGVYAHQMFPKALSLGIAGGAGSTERVFGHFVTTNYFAVLGTPSAAGRLFGAADSDRLGASPIVVLSDRFWARRFNRDPAILGQAIRLNGQLFTVIGVAPDGFQGTGVVATDVWLPLPVRTVGRAGSAASFAERGGAVLIMGGRLRQGASVAMAAAELQAIGRDLQRAYPKEMSDRDLRLVPSSSVPGNRAIVAIFMALLMGIVSMVLLVACANVSGMLLSRAAARRREIAVRLAIGAGRARLVRQLLMETAILFLIGGAAGLVLARVMTTLLVGGLPSLPFPVAVSLALDVRVIAVTMGISLLAALLSGLAPALQASKADPVAAMKEDSQGPSGRPWVRHAFVVTQVAFSLVLVVSAGLFVRALQRAGTIDPGFDPHGVELASLDLSMAGYTNATAPRFARELLERVRQLPEVQAAAIARALPGGFESMGLSVAPADARPRDGQDEFETDGDYVEPGYFATLKIPILAGRDFTTDDRAGAPPVAIMSEAAARHYWPGQNAVGKYLSQHLGRSPGSNAPATRALLVVGVVGDVKSTSLIDGMSQSLVYLPLQQQTGTVITIVARSTRGQRLSDALRTLVTSMNPNLPIVTSQTLEDLVVLGLAPQRVAATVSGSLGIVGMLLAAIGIYGVTAFAVTRRTREFGIRIALGARRADVVRMVLRQGMSLTAIGCAIGLGLAAAVSQVLTVFLFGLPPLDLPTFGGATALFVTAGLAACYGPARRATRVDPLVALRSE